VPDSNRACQSMAFLNSSTTRGVRAP
jgi:hypothetical protein